MRYILPVGAFIAFLIAASSAVKAESIRDYVLNWTAQRHGTTSRLFRIQKWFVGNSFYVTGFRLAAAIVAAALLAFAIYLTVVGDKSRGSPLG